MTSYELIAAVFGGTGIYIVVQGVPGGVVLIILGAYYLWMNNKMGPDE